MPVYNGGSKVVSGIQAAIKKFELMFPNFELIIVDDGSTDSTSILLNRMKDDRVIIRGYPTNCGKGHALIHGFQFASSEKVIFADGDMQAMPDDYQRYLSALDYADIVVSSKRVSGARVYAGARRKFLSVAFNLAVKIMLPLSVSDTQAGFKAFRRKALARILPLISVKRYAFDVELLVVAKLLNLEVAELPITVTLADGFRKKHILRMFVDLLGITFRLRFRRWYQENIAKSETCPYKPILNW
jgi:glycosyltransferase involved in cell wall biosynthesis